MFRLLLTSTFAAVLALALTCAGLAWWGSTSAAFHVQRARLAQASLTETLRLQVTVDGLLRAAVHESEPAGRGIIDLEAARRQLRAHFAEMRGISAAEIALLPDDEDERAELNRIAELEILVQEGLAQMEMVGALLASGRQAAAHDLAHRLAADGIGERYRILIEERTAREHQEAEAASYAAGRAMTHVASHARVAGLSGIFAFTFSVILLLRRFHRPLQRLSDAALAAAAGDFSRRIEPGDESDEFGRVGRSFNAMLDEVTRTRAALERSRGELEKAVAERTAELAAANASLRRSDETRRRFLADVSHELRTPITVMRGEAEIALRGQEKTIAEYRQALRRIAEEAGHTGRLVDDLLFVARSEAGEARMALEAVTLDEVVHRAVSTARALGEVAGVRVREHEGASGAVVQGDADRLRQLLVILLDNAIRYSERGREVEVSIERSAAGVMVRVADQGVGIAADELDRVFERFYRGDGAATRHAGGSGLGLPLARAIARAHGGEVTLESEPGRGTTAWVLLPVMRRLQAAA